MRKLARTLLLIFRIAPLQAPGTNGYRSTSLTVLERQRPRKLFIHKSKARSGCRSGRDYMSQFV
jgi:hypothetical protein